MIKMASGTESEVEEVKRKVEQVVIIVVHHCQMAPKICQACIPQQR